jgi:hypothetical protein
VKPPLRTATLALSAAFALIGLDVLRGTLTQRIRKVRDETDVYALPPPTYVKTASLGYREAVASVLWASTLYQYGDALSHDRRFDFAPQYVDTILALDPGFRTAYRFVSTLATMQVKAPSTATVRETRRILETGTRELPHDADVWGAYASFMMFEGAQFLGDKEKEQWRVLGAQAATRAAELGYVMDSLSYTGAIFLERAGERALAISQLERAYAVAPNDDARDRIASKLKRMHADESLKRVARAHEKTYQVWRTRFPWLTESLFVLAGPSTDVAACAGMVGSAERCTPGWTGFLATPAP